MYTGRLKLNAGSGGDRVFGEEGGPCLDTVVGGLARAVADDDDGSHES